ncbi:MAG: GerMN domain-containing protein [bacterium]|nr:GerMN domain-containing protein [bacterium]
MKTLKIAGSVALVLMVIALGIRFFSSDEDAWLCQNGQWVKHGNPSAAKPTTVCLPTGQAGGERKPDEVMVIMPQPNQTVKSPLTVIGQARGSWFFEASFPIELVDDQGRVLGQSYAQAQSDWMTENFVPFIGEISYQIEATTTGKLILKNDNPSGLPQYDKKREISVLISPNQTLLVKAFFSNNNLDKAITCEKAFPVKRQVVRTAAIARAALEELLKGPSQADLAQGFYTSINPNVKIQKLTITDGTAKVDFDETLERNMGGSCRVSAIRAQITETLKQFPTVKNVIISINGRTEDILQP